MWPRSGSGRAPTRNDAVARVATGPWASLWLTLLAGSGLLLVGVLMAVSTTIAAARANGVDGSAWGPARAELNYVLIGGALFCLAACMSPRTYRRLAYPALAVALIALVGVLVPGVGVSVNGARRWIAIGPVQLQPSEFAKLALLLWGADLLARKQELGTLRNARHLFIPVLPALLVLASLVMLEPDLGTTCALIVITLGLLWIAGTPLRYFSALIAVLATGVIGLALAAPYRLERLTTFLHPFKDAKNSGYHTVEGFYALASGGLFGVGLGQSTSKYGWVPNASTDYVFAIVGEELGLLGAVLVLALFALLAHGGFRIARRNADPFARLAAGAATIWLCGQAAINVGYVTGLLPVTGIPLPFVSSGGSSLLVSLVVLGMLTAFARHEGPAIAAARRAARRREPTRLARTLLPPAPAPYRAPPRGGRPACPAQAEPRGRTALLAENS